MGDSETGQVSEDAAKIYEEIYLPALFLDWCPLVLEAAKTASGDDIIDVACGTGALAIAAAERLGPEGSIVGVDINEGMLNIARSKSRPVKWINAAAEDLPFNNECFDRVVSQFGLMYFEDQQTALKEMLRVLRPGGTLAIAVWDRLDNNPGLAAEEYLWQRVFGDEVDEAPYRLGDTGILENIFSGAGANDIQIDTHQGTARFESIESWIHTGAMGWTEDETLTDDELKRLISIAESELTEFQTAQATVVFPTSAHIVVARK